MYVLLLSFSRDIKLMLTWNEFKLVGNATQIMYNDLSSMDSQSKGTRCDCGTLAQAMFAGRNDLISVINRTY
ncbi:hypothetical protein H2248_010588 [Termitomyces sp. 'cryptogamus']|nr:hypothetical protein H2248_010588 [Termitomyces sp. 'cryptogamus']